MTRARATATFYGLGLLWLALDHWTKWLTVSRLPLGQIWPVIPDWLAFTYVQNRGAAWSLFSGNTFALGLVSLAVSVGLLVYERRFFPRNGLQTVAYALIWSGAVGNMIDRLWHRYVVDMVYVQWHGQYFFPIF